MTVGERIKKRTRLCSGCILHYSTVAFSLPLSLFLGIGDPSIGVYEAILCFPKRNLQRISPSWHFFLSTIGFHWGRKSQDCRCLPPGQAYRTTPFVLRYRYSSRSDYLPWLSWQDWSRQLIRTGLFYTPPVIMKRGSFLDEGRLEGREGGARCEMGPLDDG